MITTYKQRCFNVRKHTRWCLHPTESPLSLSTSLDLSRPLSLSTSGVETACVGHFKLLFSLLKQTSNATMQLRALEVISKVTANRACVKDIAAANVLVFLLFTLVTLPSGTT